MVTGKRSVGMAILFAVLACCLLITLAGCARTSTGPEGGSPSRSDPANTTASGEEDSSGLPTAVVDPEQEDSEGWDGAW